MKKLETFIASGILEMYVLGLTSSQENLEVKEMVRNYPEINIELDAITEALVIGAATKAPGLDPTLKAMVMGTIDYTERLQKGEQPSFPPELNDKTTLEDFAPWLDRKDLDLSNSTEDLDLKIIGYLPERMTAIVRIVTATPYEIHDKEYEKFFIVEGTCDVVTDEKVYSLVPGDYYGVPLNMGHTIKVTSKTPCKVILQRVAA